MNGEDFTGLELNLNLAIRAVMLPLNDRTGSCRVVIL
jgi:hypothetical protein